MTRMEAIRARMAERAIGLPQSQPGPQKLTPPGVTPPPYYEGEPGDPDVRYLLGLVDDLAGALALLVSDVQDYEPWQRPCYALDKARAVLARLEG